MDVLGLKALPFLTRRNYYFEFWHLLLWSALAGLLEGPFASVVVSRSFDGSELLIAVAAATPVAALVTSIFWGMLCTGRAKIRLASWCAGGTALCAALACLIPSHDAGVIWFIGQLAVAQVLLAGVVTVRSAFWKSNYPRAVRGQITARLQAVRLVMSVGAVLAAAAWCDRDPAAYRYIFPAAGVLALLSIVVLRHIHVRGERRELTGPDGSTNEGYLRAGYIEPFSVTALLSPGQVVRRMLRVLTDDRRFARYCVAQLLTGTSNLLTVAVLVTVVTRDLHLGEVWGFWISTVLIVALPRLTMLWSLGRWGRLFDRLGVVRFRVVNIACWTAALVFGLGATLVTLSAGRWGPGFLIPAVVLFAIHGLLQGGGLGGGALAWNLGHLHFAEGGLAEVYMGVHVSLTGLRGLVAPILGMWLWHHIGWSVWLVAIALSLMSMGMYARLAREERQDGPQPVQTRLSARRGRSYGAALRS